MSNDVARKTYANVGSPQGKDANYKEDSYWESPRGMPNIEHVKVHHGQSVDPCLRKKNKSVDPCSQDTYYNGLTS